MDILYIAKIYTSFVALKADFPAHFLFMRFNYRQTNHRARVCSCSWQIIDIRYCIIDRGRDIHLKSGSFLRFSTSSIANLTAISAALSCTLNATMSAVSRFRLVKMPRCDRTNCSSTRPFIAATPAIPSPIDTELPMHRTRIDFQNGFSRVSACESI